MSITVFSAKMAIARSRGLPATLLPFTFGEVEHTEALDLVGLVDDGIARHATSADERDVRLCCLTLDEIEVLGAEDTSATVIDALISQALHEATPGTRIDCHVSAVDAWAVLQVRFFRAAGRSARTRSQISGAVIEARWPLARYAR